MITLLIVNYWSASHLRRLLTCEELQRWQPPVWVVNNSPEEKELYDLHRSYPRLTILETGGNIGFGPACNVGIQRAWQQQSHPVLWLLNPDTCLVPGALMYLQQCFERFPEVAILGTRIQTHLGEPWFDQGRFNPWFGYLPHKLVPSPESSLENVDLSPSRWVSGGSLLLQLGQFDTCPQFDPQFFLYYEDNDLCERYWQQGVAIAVTKSVLVEHWVSSIADHNLRLKWTHATLGKLLFIQRHGRGWGLALTLVLVVCKLGCDVLLGRWEIYAGRWAGLRKFLKRSSWVDPQGGNASTDNPLAQINSP